MSQTAQSIKITQFMKSAEVIFWDFDGVIKESLSIKSDAFEKLFLPYGKSSAQRVRKHHECNHGMSRYEKIPLYLNWVEEPVNDDIIKRFCDRFSNLVQQAVIDCPWVPGVREYLFGNCSSQRFALVTATPQLEILQILKALALENCFDRVYGAPQTKESAVSNCLRDWQYSPNQALLVGDSFSDFEAAKANRVAFLLKKTSFNQPLQDLHSGLSFDSLSDG